MKTALGYTVFISMLLGTGCSTNLSVNESGGSPQNPPFPKTNSVLPLAVNNQWLYSFTGYDSSGARISPDRVDLHLGITGGYGIKNDTQLIRLTWYNQSDSYSAYTYQFEWENRKKGWLVVYRDLYPLAIRGLYIIG